MVVRQAISDGRSDAVAPLERLGDRVGIVPVDAARRPAGRLEPLHLVDRVGQRQRPVDRNAVVVEQHDQLVELEMAGERDRLLADALHQIAVGGEHIGAMIDQLAAELGGEVSLGDRHADRIGKALAERSGRRLHARGQEILRMAGRDRAELAEALDLLDRHLLVAEQMEQRIDQHRAVAGREHEAVAVGPGRIGRVEFQEAREQHGRDVGRAHRQARMAGLRLLDRVHCERADRIGHAVDAARAPGRALLVSALRRGRAAAAADSCGGWRHPDWSCVGGGCRREPLARERGESKRTPWRDALPCPVTSSRRNGVKH